MSEIHLADEAIGIAVPNTGRVVPFSRRSLGAGQADKTRLNIPDGIAFEDWAAIGDALGQAEQSIMWWIGDWWAYGERNCKYWGYGERKRLLEKLQEDGHNPPAFKTCTNAGWVSRRFNITSSPRRELLSFGHHKVVAKLDDRDADWFLSRAQTNGWSVAALTDEVRRHQLERLRRPGERKYETQTVEDLHWLVNEITAGRQLPFGTIYADPPWPYGNQGTRAATKNHYKAHNELSVKDICELPVLQLAGEDAHCHLWTTSSFFREAFDVMAAWGFTYKSHFVWVKPDFGLGNYWRIGTEIMLFGIRGKCPFADNSQQNWVYAKAGEHSAKPAKVRRLIESVSGGPYLELFGRREVDNWTVWGNEVERRTSPAKLNFEDTQDDTRV